MPNYVAVIAAYSHSFALQCLPAGLPAPPSIAMQPVQLSSFALSLLLVFRTNVSYARWLDARRAFGSITTSSQDLARQVNHWNSNTHTVAHCIGKRTLTTSLRTLQQKHFREGVVFPAVSGVV